MDNINKCGGRALVRNLGIALVFSTIFAISIITRSNPVQDDAISDTTSYDTTKNSTQALTKYYQENTKILEAAYEKLKHDNTSIKQDKLNQLKNTINRENEKKETNQNLAKELQDIKESFVDNESKKKKILESIYKYLRRNKDKIPPEKWKQVEEKMNELRNAEQN